MSYKRKKRSRGKNKQISREKKNSYLKQKKSKDMKKVFLPFRIPEHFDKSLSYEQRYQNFINLMNISGQASYEDIWKHKKKDFTKVFFEAYDLFTHYNSTNDLKKTNLMLFYCWNTLRSVQLADGNWPTEKLPYLPRYPIKK